MTDLIIIGAGAAGLMAACAAGEAKLSCLLLEKRHRPGLKLLMCGNNRCNVSHAGSVVELTEQYGSHSGNFLKTALTAFSPQALREWLMKNGVPTVIMKNRIYPKSEKADDVLHCFTDRIRDMEIPFCTNAAVKSIERIPEGYRVVTENFAVEGKNVLIATGGISYPKTGSTGDGNNFAEKLGIKVRHWRPALSAMDANSKYFDNPLPTESNHFPAKVKIFDEKGNHLGSTTGNILLEKGILRGSAIFDASRAIGRAQTNDDKLGRDWSKFTLEIDMFPELPAKALTEKLSSIWKKLRNVKGAINALGVDHGFCSGLAVLIDADMQAGNCQAAAEKLKSIRLDRMTIHPTKEAIACCGGIDVAEIDPNTMEATKAPGLFFAGEAIDAEGPTGGYNLQAAFSSARLAVATIQKRMKPQMPDVADKSRTTDSDGKKRQFQPRKKTNPKSAWGKDFWAKDRRPRNGR